MSWSPRSRFGPWRFPTTRADDARARRPRWRNSRWNSSRAAGDNAVLTPRHWHSIGTLQCTQAVADPQRPEAVECACRYGDGRCLAHRLRDASRLPRERQSPEAPQFIAGTLPYMAPEQTERINRSIDSRSDLYALGPYRCRCFLNYNLRARTDIMHLNRDRR